MSIERVVKTLGVSKQTAQVPKTPPQTGFDEIISWSNNIGTGSDRVMIDTNDFIALCYGSCSLWNMKNDSFSLTGLSEIAGKVGVEMIRGNKRLLAKSFTDNGSSYDSFGILWGIRKGITFESRGENQEITLHKKSDNLKYPIKVVSAEGEWDNAVTRNMSKPEGNENISFKCNVEAPFTYGKGEDDGYVMAEIYKRVVEKENNGNYKLIDFRNIANNVAYVKELKEWILENITEEDYERLKDYGMFYYVYHNQATNNGNDNVHFFDNDFSDDTHLQWYADCFNKIVEGGKEHPNDGDIAIAMTYEWIKKCIVAKSVVNSTEPDIVHYYASVSGDNLTLEWQNKYFDNNRINPNILYIAEGVITLTKEDNGEHLVEYFELLESEYPDRVGKRKYDDFIVTYNIGEMSSTLEEPFPDETNFIKLLLRCDDGNNRNVVCVWIDIRPNNYGEIVQVYWYEYNGYVDDITKGKRPINKDDDDTTDDDDGKKPPSDSDPPVQPPTNTITNLLTRTYSLTKLTTKALGNYLWSTDWLPSLEKLNNNPIENIVSCKMFPLDLDFDATANITVGNVDTKIVAKVTDNSKKRIKKGSIKINRFYNSFLDYEPYTKMKLYIPFIGFTDIDTTIMYEGTVELVYIFDYVTASFTVELTVNDYIYKTYNGTCGVDIPLTSNNRSQQQLARAMSIATGALSENVWVGLGLGAVDALTNHPTQSQTTTSPSSDTALFMPYTPFVVVSRSIVNKGDNYNHDIGRPCTGSYYIRDLSGYTEVDSCQLKAPFTKEELDMALDIMRSGFYV